MPPLPTLKSIPKWKLIQPPLWPISGTAEDAAPFIIMFLLLALAALLMWRLKRRQGARHAVQVIAACAFVLGVSPCACMVRDIILGTRAINVDNLWAFRKLAIVTTVAAFAFVFGRGFCGWICPLGALQELATWLSEVATGRLSAGIRSTVKYVAAVVLVGAITLGLVVFKPDTFVFIEMAMVFWVLGLFVIVLFDLSRKGSDRGLKRIRYVSLVSLGLIYFVGINTAGPVCVMFRNSLDYSSIISAFGVVVAALLVGLAWCKFLCPEGALFGLASSLSRWGVVRGDGCKGCNTCGDACRMNAIESGEIDDTSCVLCGRCMERCPEEVLRYGRRSAL